MCFLKKVFEDIKDSKETEEEKIIKKYNKKGYQVYRIHDQLFICKGKEQMNYLFNHHDSDKEMVKFLKNNLKRMN